MNRKRPSAAIKRMVRANVVWSAGNPDRKCSRKVPCFMLMALVHVRTQSGSLILPLNEEAGAH